MKTFHGEMDSEPTRRRPSLWGLVIPADPLADCRVVQVDQTAEAISAVIGGGLIDEAVCDVRGLVNRTGRGPNGKAHTVYQDVDRDRLGLPANARALVLAARLDWPHLPEGISLRGSVLVLGLDPDGNDTNVPNTVLAGAAREGLIQPLAIIAAVARSR